MCYTNNVKREGHSGGRNRNKRRQGKQKLITSPFERKLQISEKPLDKSEKSSIINNVRTNKEKFTKPNSQI